MKLTIAAPNPKQKEFFQADTRYVAYGGARGGGKSWAVRTKATLMAAKYPGIRILIMRKTFPELRENHILPLTSGLHGIANYNESKKVFSFINGSRIKFGYCDAQTDVTQYQGQEFDVIFMDEATHFTEYQFNAIKSCLRGVNNFPKRFYLTCNPGGVGHGWVKRLFIDRDYREGEDPADYTFIAARVYDNTALLDADPEYVKALLALPDGMRSAWLEGNWDAFAGQFFSEFRRDIHVIKPCAIPDGSKIYRAFDYGLDMLACLWIAVTPAGQALVFREAYAPNLIVSEAARFMKSATHEDIYETFAPPDMWNRQRETGKSIAELFSEYGIDAIKADNSRVTGWMNVKEWLKLCESENGLSANLKIFESCPFLIKCLCELRYDEKNPCDAAVQPHDITHITDALRYFCVSRVSPGKNQEEVSPLEKYRRSAILKQKKKVKRAFS
ncbi:MAG: hypothetical protein HFE78_02465 [Clostridiales bacterium]|nr:hypothetical protein [Clostridiales bacterium]